MLEIFKMDLIKFFLSKIGWQVVKTKTMNFRNTNFHPLDVFNKIGNKREGTVVLLNIPVSKCRTQIWNTLEVDKNPFVQTILNYSQDKILDYKSSAINSYYSQYQPRNAAEVLKISNNTALENSTAAEYVLPWDNHSSEEIIKKRERVALNENRRAGNKLGLSSGYTDFGPVSQKKGEIEFTRLTKIFEAIKKNGYKEKPYLNDGGIRGYFLVDEDWCFIITSGKHRAYALSAMGYTDIPVIVDTSFGTVKRKEDIPHWTQVKNGTFTKTETVAFVSKILEMENKI